MDKNQFRLDPSTYQEIPMARDIPFPVVPHVIDNVTPVLDKVREALVLGLSARDTLNRSPKVIVMVFEVTRSRSTILYTHTTASMIAFGRTPLSTFKTLKRDMLRLGTMNGLDLKLAKILPPGKLVEFAKKNNAYVDFRDPRW